jgi:hypothetical protein
MEKIAKRKNGCGIAGFILALIGLIICWVPILNIVSLVLCGLGFLLCFIGLFLKNRKKGLTIVGLLFALAGIAVFIVEWGAIIGLSI